MATAWLATTRQCAVLMLLHGSKNGALQSTLVTSKSDNGAATAVA